MTDEHDTATADLPTPAAGPQMRMVALAAITPSPTNPRRHFDAEKLQELANSIAATGVHQPVLLRPLPAERLQDTYSLRQPGEPLPEYELVAGERRFRACKLAGVAEIPAMIRPLTDAQALEIQIIENLQRADVTKLEEAEGYRALMDATGQSAYDVAAKVGKSRSYVFAVMKVLDLCERGRQMLRDGIMDFSVALPVARIPAESLQLKMLDHIQYAHDHSEGYTARQASQQIRREFMLRLDRADFNTADAELVPRAGACQQCPHRTGANPDLFADVDSADVCTNPPCYHAKEEAHAAQLRKTAEDQGLEVIDGREAKAMMPSAYSQEVRGYLRLDSTSDSPVKGKTLRKLVDKVLPASGIKPTMVVSPHSGEMVAVVTPAQAQELLAMAGADEAREKIEAEAQRDAKHAAESAKEQSCLAYEQAWRDEVLRACIERLSQDDHISPSGHQIDAGALHVCAARHELQRLNQAQAKRLAKLFGVQGMAPLEWLQDWTEAAVYPENMLFAVLALRDVEHLPWMDKRGDTPNATLMLAAESLGVDVIAIKAQTQANRRADKAQAEAATGTSTPTPAARAGDEGGRKAQEGKGGKKGKGDAKQRDAAVPRLRKTSAGEAQAQIAQAMQAADAAGEPDPGAAAAAQGDEGPATPAGAVADVAADATPGPANDSASERPAIGTRVRVIGGQMPKQIERRGQTGTVTRHMGESGVDVAFDTGHPLPAFCAFDAAEVAAEADQADQAEQAGPRIEPDDVLRAKGIRYRNPATGATWSGRGKTPRWLHGQDLAQYEIGGAA